MRHFRRSWLLVPVLSALTSIAPAQGTGRQVSLDEALRMALPQSEAIRVAQAGVLRSQGQVLQARSQYMPQLAGTASYSRTLASQFEALAAGEAPLPPPGTPPVPPRDTTTFFTPCTRYLAAAGSSEAAKVAGLEAYARCTAGAGGGIDFSRVGFGSRNQYSLGIQGTLTVFSGGRVQAQNRAARAGELVADIELAAQRAQLALDVTEAYFDAVLAERLVAIAESSLVQSEGTLRQTRLARDVGNQSEFELLRAQVTRDNQMPALIQRRTDRELAYLRLKQLLNLPYNEALTLTTAINEDAATPARAVAMIGDQSPDTSTDARSTVRQLEQSVTAEEANLSVARSQWVPSITVSSQYGKVNFPSDLAPGLTNWLTNWTVSVGASFPIFTGGAIRGGTLIARAGVDEAKARLGQTRKLAALEARQVAAQLEQAQSALAASVGTTEQAARAYSIAEVRFREGISTQLELSEGRLLLEQARANRALAARNLEVARMRLQLLKDLPLGVGAAGGTGGLQLPAGGAAAPGGAPGGAVAPQQQRQRSAPAATATIGTGQGQ
ncbi:MAG: TolC family protein [Gemmatimonadota bacterium]